MIAGPTTSRMQQSLEHPLFANEKQASHGWTRKAVPHALSTIVLYRAGC